MSVLLVALFATVALGAGALVAADHSAEERHVEVGHGPHDGSVTITDDGVASRGGSADAVPAPAPDLTVSLNEAPAPIFDVADAAPGHPPPRAPATRSPPISV